MLRAFCSTSTSVESTIEILRDAVARDPAGELKLRSTPDLAKMRSGGPRSLVHHQGSKRTRIIRRCRPAGISPTGSYARSYRAGAARPEHLGPAAPHRAHEMGQQRGRRRAGSSAGPEARTSLYLVMLGIALVLLKEVLPVLAVMAVGGPRRDPAGGSLGPGWLGPGCNAGRAYRDRSARCPAAAR